MRARDRVWLHKNDVCYIQNVSVNDSKNGKQLILNVNENCKLNGER